MIDRLPMLDALDDLPACTSCGKCCHLLVELTPLVDDVPEEFVVEHSGVRCMDQHGDGACVALDAATQLCTIYERRPQVCRDFQRGASLCRRAVSGRRGSLAPLAALP
jgi:Fe-S-cluster containining protein